MIYTAATLPKVPPMQVRRIHPVDGWAHIKDKMLTFADHPLEVEEVEIADSRLPFDEDVVDVSNFVFQFTTSLMLDAAPKEQVLFMFFTSRRWRNHRWVKREGEQCDMEWPTDKEPLLFIGNPFIVSHGPEGIIVHREPSYLIKSGCQLQAE